MLHVNVCPLCNNTTARITYFINNKSRFLQVKESNFCFNHDLLVSVSANIFNNMYKISIYTEVNNYLYAYVYYINNVNSKKKNKNDYKSSIVVLTANESLSAKNFEPASFDTISNISDKYLIWKSIRILDKNKPLLPSIAHLKISSIVNFY